MQAIVLTFDHLPVGFLGCYGKDWIETPNFDRLAAESVVFDQHFGEDFDPSALEHCWWTGCYHFPRSDAAPWKQTKLTEALAAADVATWLVVEKAAALSGPKPPRFDRVVEVDSKNDFGNSDVPFARLVAQAQRCLEESAAVGDQNLLLWLKSAGVPSPWGVGDELALARASQYLRRLEPAFDEILQPEAEAAIDPDTGGNTESHCVAEIVAIDQAQRERNNPSVPLMISDTELDQKRRREWNLSRCLYAAHVTQLDYWLGQLLDSIEQLPGDQERLLIVTAAAGDAFLQSQALPGKLSKLAEERVHVPLIIRAHGSRQAGRSQRLTQAVDLAATLVDWFGVAPDTMPREGESLLPVIRGEQRYSEQREFLCLGADGPVWGIRTEDFYLVQQADDPANKTADGSDPPARSLFVKPDDVWEIHNVADQFIAEADGLAADLDRFVERAQSSIPMTDRDEDEPAPQSYD
jgi:arylsulfatase A-like enzyme